MSNRINAMTESYEVVTVFDKLMIFTNFRIDRKSVPENLYLYEVRHGDDDWDNPYEIGEWILVNCYGSLISKEPLELTKSEKINNAYVDVDPEKDWNFEGFSCTLQEYIDGINVED